MKSGFVTEAHVVIYCHGCGDHYREQENESICFDSVNQAIAYLSVVGAGVGWTYDGERVLCDGCLASVGCNLFGHVLSKPRCWPLGSESDSRTCTVCGISDTEIEE